MVCEPADVLRVMPPMASMVFAKPLKSVTGHLVDGNANQGLEGLNQEGRAPRGVGSIDLVAAVAGDRDVEVTRHMDQVDALAVI